MKKFVAATFIFANLLFHSCEPPATFDTPQPGNGKSLTFFPELLQGNYLAADQASIVTITDKLVTRHYDFDFKEHKDSIGSSYRVTEDTLIHLTDGTREMILLNGDTVIRHGDWIDTLFNISDDNVLKKFKGYYFLNNRYNDNGWEVKKLSLKKGVLAIGTISDKEDIQKLKEITETTADTISTQFNLTRRQFKTFVRQGGFGQLETFNRMSEKDK